MNYCSYQDLQIISPIFKLVSRFDHNEKLWLTIWSYCEMLCLVTDMEYYQAWPREWNLH